jgi:hypothetical protein
MDVTTAVAWTIAFSFLLFALLRRQQIPMVVPIATAAEAQALPDDDDEEMPETDRAPRRAHWLAAAVVVTAALRVGLLVAVHR